MLLGGKQKYTVNHVYTYCIIVKHDIGGTQKSKEARYIEGRGKSGPGKSKPAKSGPAKSRANCTFKILAATFQLNSISFHTRLRSCTKTTVIENCKDWRLWHKNVAAQRFQKALVIFFCSFWQLKGNCQNFGGCP